MQRIKGYKKRGSNWLKMMERYSSRKQWIHGFKNLKHTRCTIEGEWQTKKTKSWRIKQKTNTQGANNKQMIKRSIRAKLYQTWNMECHGDAYLEKRRKWWKKWHTITSECQHNTNMKKMEGSMTRWKEIQVGTKQSSL